MTVRESCFNRRQKWWVTTTPVVPEHSDFDPVFRCVQQSVLYRLHVHNMPLEIVTKHGKQGFGASSRVPRMALCLIPVKS